MSDDANVGSAKSPIDFGQGRLAYKRNGRWHLLKVERRRFRSRFVEITDSELLLELESRGYQLLNPAHECVDRPNLPCPACERIAQHRRESA